ncbi:adenylate cyclase [Neptunitalea sp. Y10]|uniref:Adenylate cyclase n=2 Tax=Neptunitalea lumnitzerae TaxID=2965509 RepID=A0ABQ5MK50_9FLAO|nr:adenylate cyclase [Neptunitalea sp. Y10]
MIKYQDVQVSYLQWYYGFHSLSKELIYILSFVFSAMFGSLMALVHLYGYPKWFASASLLKDMGIRLACFVVIFSMSYLVIVYGIGIWLVPETKEVHIPLVNDEIALMFLGCLLINSFADFLLLVRKNMGPAYFSYIMQDKYYKPQEEDRVFMFLDMVSSTTMAEAMGHVQFSTLLQECFQKLSSLLLKYDAEIYQYVGDEAVITWKLTSNFQMEKCVDLYFDFSRMLLEAEHSFTEKYGWAPSFSAAIHQGKVTMALVGDLKKELAFHGDVLNTTARMQALCKDYQVGLMVSKEVYQAMEITKTTYQYREIKEVILQGKRKEITLYSVKG